MGFQLTEEEIEIIRAAMAIHTMSKQPKLLWTGWRTLAEACAIGAKHARKASGGPTETPLYIRKMSEFLRKTGFVFINKDDRAAAVRLLPQWDAIDDWRSSLSPSRQAALNNPREIERVYNEERHALGDPDARKPYPSKRHHRKYPKLIELYEALAEQLELANEARERAEAQSAYFAEMMQAVADRAKLSDDEMADIRSKVRAAHQAEAEQPED